MTGKEKLSTTKKRKLKSAFSKHIAPKWQLYLMLFPFLLWYALFVYKPMWGLQIAFKEFNVFKGMAGSPWVGFENFSHMFGSEYFLRALYNTLIIGFYTLIFSFPAPILFALLLNEVSNARFKKVIQTCTYIPHFISAVVIAGLITSFLAPSNGLFNIIRENLGLEKIYFLSKPEYFRPMFIIQGIWCGFGYGSIVYIAAINGIDQELYEAAKVDGCGRFRQVLYITLPGISQMIVIMFIMKIGQILKVNFEKILLLYQPATYSVSDVLSTYTYRMGIEQSDYGVSTAIGLFDSVVGFVLVWIANKVSNKVSDSGLW